MNQNLFLPIKTDLHERKTVIIATPEKLMEFAEYNWPEIIKDALIPFRQLLKTFNKESLNNDSLNFPKFILNFEDAKKEFRFPVDHPIDGEIYACSELAPNYYMPLEDFNQNQYNSKMHDFVSFCASLGAKTCSVVKYEEKGVEKSIKAAALNIPTNVGNASTEIEVNSIKNNDNFNTIAIKFSEPIEQYAEFKSRWIQDEQTWGKMAEMRNNYNILSYNVSFGYKDTNLFDGKSRLKLNNSELKVQQKSSDKRDFKIEFNVEFWPKPKPIVIKSDLNWFKKFLNWLSHLF